MSGHTPGPWAVNPVPFDDCCHVCGIDGPDGAHIADIADRRDARLIKAAPDLLEAARDALSGWRYIRKVHGDMSGVGWNRVEDNLLAAIAKATGDAE